MTTAVDSIARARRSLELGPARSLRRELANAAGPIGWALVATVLLSVAAAAAGYDPFLTDTWSRWDSDRYVWIATDGYHLQRCTANPGNWCGNAGWFPSYPWLVGLLSLPGLPAQYVALAVARLFALGTLVLLRVTFLRGMSKGQTAAGLAFAAFVPGAVYHQAIFPMSLLAFFSVLGLWLLTRERWALGAAAIAVAAGSYHLGVLLIPVVAVYALAVPSGAGVAGRLRRGALVSAIAALGPLAMVAALQVQTGTWNAFFLIQERYRSGFYLPGEGLHYALQPLYSGGLTSADIESAQVLLTVLLVAAVSLDLARRRRDAMAAEWLLLGVTLVLWLFPLMQDNVGLYRTAAVLVPAAPLVARLPAPARVALCAGAILIAAPMAVLFFQKQII